MTAIEAADGPDPATTGPAGPPAAVRVRRPSRRRSVLAHDRRPGGRWPRSLGHHLLGALPLDRSAAACPGGPWPSASPPPRPSSSTSSSSARRRPSRSASSRSSSACSSPPRCNCCSAGWSGRRLICLVHRALLAAEDGLEPGLRQPADRRRASACSGSSPPGTAPAARWPGSAPTPARSPPTASASSPLALVVADLRGRAAAAPTRCATWSTGEPGRTGRRRRSAWSPSPAWRRRPAAPCCCC